MINLLRNAAFDGAVWALLIAHYNASLIGRIEE
jgi:hypothetical protein